MLDIIRRSLSKFTPSERRIAEAVLDNPSTAITWSISDTARIAAVSEPSVVRFCRRLDCDGFPDFRLKLAQQLAIQQQPLAVAGSSGDPFVETVDDIFNRAAKAIHEARQDTDLMALRRAIDILAAARRVDVYGYGGSGFLAAEAQHRMASLGMASVAYADPTLQMVSAPRLTRADAVLALSFSGLTSYLISNLEIARKAGARIVTISPAHSVVANLAEVNLTLNAHRLSVAAAMVPTGRAPMYVLLDVLFALLAGKLPAGGAPRPKTRRSG